MNKYVALALAACLFSVVSGQNTTTNTTLGTSGSWCRSNAGCDQTKSFCCAKTSVLSYNQFNCQTHKNGTATTGTCLANGTDYTAGCVGEAKTCISSVTPAAYCGGSIGMAAVDVLPNVSCTSGAYNLMMSLGFLVMIALSYAL
jgi:hypothetical protein